MLYVIEWDGTATVGDTGRTTTTFEFEPVDDGARTLVTITAGRHVASAGAAGEPHADPVGDALPIVAWRRRERAGAAC
jgi:hypothetical protein